MLAAAHEGPAPDEHGCYLEVWRDPKYEGEYFRIEGPGEYQALEFGSLIWADSPKEPVIRAAGSKSNA